jgi:predicted HTH domain antitoxin
MTRETITKSVRLTPGESAELAELSELTALTEANLMKRWIQEGIRTQKLELAVTNYLQRKTDLRNGAAMAGVSYNRFVQELQARNIIILDDDRFLERLEMLSEMFKDETLKAALEQLTAEQSPIA